MLTGRKLLLADDSPAYQKVVSLTFRDEGVAVVAVGSGAAALKALAQDAPDVILADVHMPAPDGYALCAHVKGDARLRHIPVLLLVGTFEPFDEAEARRVGADGVLTKPFQSIRGLVSRVGSLLSGHAEEAQTETTPPPDAARQDERAAPPADAQAADAPAFTWAHQRAESQTAATTDAHAYTDFDLDDQTIQTTPAESFGAHAAEPTATHGGATVVPEVEAEGAYAPRPADEFTSHSAEEFRPQTTSEFKPRATGEFAARAAEEFTSQASGEFAAQSAGEAAAQSADEVAAQSADEFAVQSVDEFAARRADESAPRQAADESFDPFAETQPAVESVAQARGAAAASYGGASAQAAGFAAPAAPVSPASDDALLDLGDSAPAAGAAATEESILDLGFEEFAAEPAAATQPASAESTAVEATDVEATAQPETGQAEAHGPETTAEPPQAEAPRVQYAEGLATSHAEAVEPLVAAAAPQTDARALEADALAYALPPQSGQAVELVLPAEQAAQVATDATVGQAEPETDAQTDSTAQAESAAQPATSSEFAAPAGVGVQLSPETIDAIARRVVELMGDKVIREIAWEVVPELAERLINRRIEEERTHAR
ncbi:MAG TPA: response regulator [Pyrinomonadaceae bacterium]|jgi:CheY-like chemotaxis protein